MLHSIDLCIFYIIINHWNFISLYKWCKVLRNIFLKGRGSNSKNSEVKFPYNQVMAFLKIAHTMYIFPTALNDIFWVFLKSTNLKKLIMSPKSHSTETRTVLIQLLNSSICGLIQAARYGTIRCTLSGYAGSPYNAMGSPVGKKA